MSHHAARRAVLLLLPITAVTVLASCTSPARVATPAVAPADTADAIAAARSWWRAFAVADTASLQTSTAPQLSLTLSNGQVLDRAAMLVDALTHTRGSTLTIEWSEVSVQHPAPGRVAFVTGRVREGNQGGANRYRYLTVLERDGGPWRVSAAQSTRELVLTPAASAQVVGALAEYAGSYRGPRGGGVQITVRDSALALVDGAGTELRLVPIGPALFESSVLSVGNGVLRFAFTRDTTGRVTALNRLINGAVNTWVRVP